MKQSMIFNRFHFLILVVALVPFHLFLRMIFFVWNRTFFREVNSSLFELLKYAFQIDLASIALINLPVIFLLMMSGFTGERIRRSILRVAYLGAILINALGFAINILDIGYFRYNKERSTIGLLAVITDSLSFVPGIVTIYWPLIVLFLILVALLIFALRFFLKKLMALRPLSHRQGLLSALLTVPILFIVIRGWHSGTLMPATPLLKVSAINLPLAQNSVHNFLYSIVRKQDQLQRKRYFTEKQMAGLVATDRLMGKRADSMNKKNVVLFILESFSQDYFQPGNPYRAITPFFDSLIGHSTYYPNAFANGFVSNQGIVAILAGLPSFIDEPFYYSTYANTKMEAIGSIFKKNGYDTNFFMGAGEDHFGFGKFCKMIGIDHYYGRKAFNNDRYYDGNWGIFDEPFLQFGIRKLNQKRTPFFSVFFTISSHPPFTIPEKYKEKFNYLGQSPAQHSISYVDYAFRQFFDSCKNASWFKNTLFVFCADHWLNPDYTAEWSQVNCSSIPIFIFDPSDPSGKNDPVVAGQVDIIPTILDKLNYNGNYTGFGKSLLDTSFKERYVVNRLNYIHQIITDGFVLGYNEPLEKVQYFYHYATDSQLKHDLADDPGYEMEKERLLKIVRANIQQYNNSLLKRSLYSR